MYKKKTDELKKRYEEAGVTLTAKELILKCVEKLSSCREEILTQIRKASECVNRLRQIALRPTMSTVDYIEIFISKENAEQSKGWEERKKQLKVLKERAKLKDAVERNEVLSLSLICQSKLNILLKIKEKILKRNYRFLFHVCAY